MFHIFKYWKAINYYNTSHFVLLSWQIHLQNDSNAGFKFNIFGVSEFLAHGVQATLFLPTLVWPRWLNSSLQVQLYWCPLQSLVSQSLPRPCGYTFIVYFALSRIDTSTALCMTWMWPWGCWIKVLESWVPWEWFRMESVGRTHLIGTTGS